MNRLQQIEFEMLKEFVRICEELNLRYYLVCGSALGAAKYGGFIPWDDDIDVGMPRKDYNIFCEKAQALLPPHLFLQNSSTDKSYPLFFSKIRHNGTTYIEKSYSKTNMNHGIYIDVFPLDGYPADAKLQQKLEKEKLRYNLTRLCCLNIKRTWKTALLVAFQKLLCVHKHPERFVKRLESVISGYSTEGSDVWCNHGNWQGKLEYAPKEQYGKGAMVSFEGLTVRIPEKYDEYLTQKYGDWRADLPEDQKVGHHHYEICDVDNPYTIYVKILANGKILIVNK